MCLRHVWYWKKTIWLLGFSRSPGNKFLAHFESKYEYCVYFHSNFFRFTKKFLTLLTIHALIWNILPHYTPTTQIIFFYWFLLVDIQNYANKINGSLTKISLQICYKDIKRLKHRHFSGSYQRNRIPSAKHLWQTSFFRLWLRARWKDSRGERWEGQIQLKIEDHDYVFYTWYIFHNNRTGNIYGQVYS